MGSADERAETQGAEPEDDGPPILVGIDGSRAARTALVWAAAEARRWNRPLLVVHAFEPPPVATGFAVTPELTDPWIVEDAAVRLAHNEAKAVLGPRNGLKVDVEVVCGPPAPTLAEMSRDAELVVVGSRGRGGFTGLLLGSVSQHLSHHSRCPVVIVREPEA
ncbi:MAG TPA: universal stress protein [Acidimicrobiales bacterium]|nr:universal stress protein [Acidimicrobiales bacterium]